MARLEDTVPNTVLNALIILDAIGRTRGDYEYSTSNKVTANVNRRWFANDDEPYFNSGGLGSYFRSMEEWGWVERTPALRNPRGAKHPSNYMKTGPNAIWLTEKGKERLKLLHESTNQG